MSERDQGTSGAGRRKPTPEQEAALQEVLDGEREAHVLTHTHVSTYNGWDFANPYLVCNACGGWITGMLDNPGRPILMPCEHDQGYEGVCPSWGPVDGCTCAATLGHVPHGEPPEAEL